MRFKCLIEHPQRHTKQSAPIVETNAKFHSNQTRADLFTAENAGQTEDHQYRDFNAKTCGIATFETIPYYPQRSGSLRETSSLLADITLLNLQFVSSSYSKGIFLPSKSRFDTPNSSSTSFSCSAVNTGPSLHTRYRPITQLPHNPMAHRIRRSRLASKAIPYFAPKPRTFRIICSGPQV